MKPPAFLGSLSRTAALQISRAWRRLVTAKSSPERIAWGFALGIFIGFTPTFGAQNVLSFLAAVLLRVNPIASVLGCQVTNYVTVLPIYYFNYRLGCLLLGHRAVWNMEMMDSPHLWRFLGYAGMVLLDLWCGSLLVAIASLAPSYYSMLFAVRRYRRIRSIQHKLAPVGNVVRKARSVVRHPKPEEEAVGAGASWRQPTALYLHIPFCEMKCNYCDFDSVPVEGQPVDDYVEALLKEVEDRAAGHVFSTVYIGGGTPTCLSAKQLERLLTGLNQLLGWKSDPPEECTVEANPGSLDPEKVAILRARRVNRFSLGIQTFQREGLVLLGRIHTAKQAEDAVLLIRNGGFRNLNVDLLYGWPGQSAEQLRDDLKRIAVLDTEHVSAYCLSVESGTPLELEVRSGRVKALGEDALWEMTQHVWESLERKGRKQYEVSNFALEGFQCQHNLVYWNNGEYIGCGASAASYVQGERTKNLSDPKAYVEAVQAGQTSVETSERLSSEASARETLILGLRMLEGVELHSFRERSGHDALALGGQKLQEHVGAGRLEVADGRLRLTRKGLMVADSVWADIV